MKKLLKKIGVYRETVIIHDGFGYMQGTNMRLSFELLYIFGVRLVTWVDLHVAGEWTKKMRMKIEADAEQEKKAPYTAKIEMNSK